MPYLHGSLVPKHAADTGKRPQPLLTRAGIVAAIAALIGLLVTLGVLPAATGKDILDAADIVVGAIFTIVAAVSPLVHAFLSRGVVTPTSDPQNDAGVQLVPIGSPQAVNGEVDAALARADEIHPSTVAAA